MRILLVEDDDATRMLMELILQNRGHVVDSCVDAESAWVAQQKDPYPLILTDWILPGMSGLDLCRKVRTCSKGAGRTLILIVTARSHTNDLQEVLAAGADDYIGKPLDIELFRIRLAIAERNVLHMQERKKAEERLRSTSSRLSTLIQNLQAGILVEDEHRQIAVVNQDFCAMFNLPVSQDGIIGVQSGELLKKSMHVFKTPEESLKRMKDIVRNNALVTGDELVLNDGRILEFDYIPIVSEESYLGYLWQFRDCTDRRRAEIELVQAREREVEVSSKIQQTLLLGVPPSDLEMVRIHALTLPSQRVDGDFYDFIKYNNRCVDLIIGDVMGKGITAALLGAATKSYFQRAISELLTCSRQIPQPEEIVTLVHQKITRQLIKLESFVTLIYARFDMEKKQFLFVNCGHPSVIHYQAKSSSCSFLPGLNTPLGIFEREEYKQVSIDVEYGDFFFFYSDGITEAMNEEKEQYGEERLLHFLTNGANQHPQIILDRIRRNVIEFTQSDSFADDFTCIGVSVTEPGRDLPLARASIHFSSSLQGLTAIREYVVQLCLQHFQLEAESEILDSLVLAVVEAATNIIRHSYQGNTTKQLIMEAEAYTGSIVIRLIYEGAAFDPGNVPQPKLDGTDIGGLGLFIIRQSVDEVNYYQNAAGQQCIDLIKKMK